MRVATGEFLTAIGFVEVEAPTLVEVAGDNWHPADQPTPVECVVARYALPEDAHQFSLVVVQHPDTARRTGAMGRQPPGTVPMCAAGGGHGEGAGRCAGFR